MYIFIYNTRYNNKPTTVRVCVSVKPEREQNVSPISMRSFRILHVVLFFFECKISNVFFIFFIFFFNLAVEELVYVTLKRSNFSRLNTKI